MSGPHKRNSSSEEFLAEDSERIFESKIELENATVYIHKQDDESRSRAIHIDIEHSKLQSSFCVCTNSPNWEHPDLNEIIKSFETA